MIVTKITAATKKTIRSRPEKGAQQATTVGSPKAAASETAPRIPAQPVTNDWRHGGVG
jgi:hypothetical protein